MCWARRLPWWSVRGHGRTPEPRATRPSARHKTSRDTVAEPISQAAAPKTAYKPKTYISITFVYFLFDVGLGAAALQGGTRPQAPLRQPLTELPSLTGVAPAGRPEAQECLHTWLPGTPAGYALRTAWDSFGALAPECETVRERNAASSPVAAAAD